MTTAKFFWYLHRLRAMEPAEIAGRVAEKTRKWTTASAMASLESFQLAAPTPLAPPRLHKREEAPVKLVKAVAQDAARIRSGAWTLFGWKTVDVGTPPRWNHDFHHDTPVPTQVESHKLDHRNLEGGADARCVWEINRWTELVRLAQNAWLNDQPADAGLVQSWLADWCEHNPPALGLQWTSALEVSLRLINFCWIDALIRACDNPELTAAQETLAQRIVPVHAWWAWRNRSFGSSANNHLIGELAGVVIASRRWPCLTRLGCCGERAWQMLEKEILRQFAPDGGNREQALHYHLFAWEMSWQAALAVGDLATPVLPRLREAARFFTLVTTDQPSWDYGDSDDASITPLPACRGHGATEWRAWFSGSREGASLGFWLGDSPVTDVQRTPNQWRSLPDSGIVARESGPWMIRADASPLGLGRLAAHGHLDALHVSLWHEGEPVLVDPGTGAYFSDSSIRADLADWKAHNGPVPVIGRELPKRLGCFLWSGHHPVPRVELDPAADQCVIRFANESSPFVKRSLRTMDAMIEIDDQVTGSMPHQVTWQFAPDTRVEAGDTSGEWRLDLATGIQLRIGFTSTALSSVNLVSNPVSSHFGKIDSAPALQVQFIGALQTCVAVA